MPGACRMLRIIRYNIELVIYIMLFRQEERKMVRLSKKCSNCLLEINIDPQSPPSICPFCGKTILYSAEETELLKIAGSTLPKDDNKSGAISFANANETVFTILKPQQKIARILIGIVAALFFMGAGFFLINAITGNHRNVQQDYSVQASAGGKTPVIKTTAPKATSTPTKIATPTQTPAPTATPIPMIAAPGQESYIGRKYEEVKMDFKNAGFKNIVTYPLKDMSIDIGGTHIGNVESISINGNINYEAGTLFPADAVVKISYHSMK